MKFTILSHAGLSIEEKGESLIVDPWLIGSCYWRSWWNFPEPDRALIDSLRPTAIYLSHLHWDHFHGPSLKLFDPKTKILVPKTPTRRMIRDLQATGFKNIEELSHGKFYNLNNKLSLYSYQFGPSVDSALIITNGKTTLLNANDCKIFGLSLRQITNKFSTIDFAFRSHSSAGAIPHCLQDYQNKENLLRSPKNYAEEFTNFALSVRAKYAIPFASNHCFLHRDTTQYNTTITDPSLVHDIFTEKAKRLNLRAKVVIMPPGSSWSEEDVFQIRSFDYKDKEAYVHGLMQKYKLKLEETYTLEDNSVGNFKAFEKYFQKFLNSTPRWLRARMGKSILFKVTSAREISYWRIDTLKATVSIVSERQEACFIIETPSSVLNDCTKKKMFSVWTASKRLKIFLPQNENLRFVTSFFTFLDLYELDLLPIGRNFTSHYLGIYLRRWREVLESFRFFFIYKVMRHKIFDPSRLYITPSSKS